MSEKNQMLNKTGEKLAETLEHMRRATNQASATMNFCCDPRLGSLTLGIMMSVVYGLSTITCIAGLVYVGVVTSTGHSLDFYQLSEGFLPTLQVARLVVINAIITAALIVSLLEFSFAVVLAHGVSKNLSSHLQVYIVYSNIKSCLLAITSVLLYILLWDNVPGSLALLATGVNTVLTVMVHVAHKRVKASASQSKEEKSDLPLQEKTTAPVQQARPYLNPRTCAVFVGILTSVICVICMLGSIGGMIALFLALFNGNMFATDKGPAYKIEIDHDVTSVLIINGVLNAVLIFSLLDLTFSIILTVGAIKRQPSLLKVYYPYSIVRFVITLLAVLMCFSGLSFIVGAIICIGVNIFLMKMCKWTYNHVNEPIKVSPQPQDINEKMKVGSENI